MSFLKRTLPSRTAKHEHPPFPRGIKVWHDLEEAQVDIVFVHGLTGDRDRTWTHPLSSEPWPKTLLPTYLPTARILTFGYDAYSVRRGAAVTNQMVDHSRDFLNILTSFRHMTLSSTRPLIFVGHSLGGLVCKDSILQSKNSPDPHLRKLFECIRAIAFLGTPHGGSDLAMWAKIPAKALGIVKSTNTDLLSILQTGSEVLARIQSDFYSMLRKFSEDGRCLNITCFWESLPMPHVGTIVARASASLAGYNAISIHADHRDMVRFQNEEESGFLGVVGELKRWADDLAEVLDVDSTSAVSAEMPRKEQETECLKSLFFVGMDSRRANIESPNPRTCEWIFDHPSYKTLDRLDNDLEALNLLWIKGKPGSGKSTLMKRITEESNRHGIDCLNFFFNARGAKIENSSHGLYRSLVFQLLQRSETTMNAFLPHYLEKKQRSLGAKVTWMTPELSDFFHSAISDMLSNPTYLFIDALDECAEDEVRKVVRRLEDSLAAASSRGTALKVCVSSRHYPHISLRNVTGREIIMEDYNEKDIEQYVLQELKFHESELRKELAAMILKKSAGVFMWTELVVRRLLKASDQGYGAEQMRILLDNVPPSLEGLLSDIILSLEADRQAALPLLAAWVICTMRPLTPYELFVALAFSAEKPPLSLIDPSIQEKRVDLQRFSRYLIDASGGLFEIASSGRVQVIHDSVRDFFLHSQIAAKILSLPEVQGFQQYSHKQIVAGCVHYFHSMEVRKALPLPEVGDRLSVAQLVAMLYKPMMIPFKVFALHGTTYFYEFAFNHLRRLYQSNGPSVEDLEAPLTQSSRKIFEGWLVFLYYFVLETGQLSANQCKTLDILHRTPSMIGLSVDEFSKIDTCVNLLVVFVNKTMKDGFTLKSPSPLPQRALSSGPFLGYLRLFFSKGLPIRFLSESGLPPFTVSDEYEYPVLSMSPLDRLTLGRSPRELFAFGFSVTALYSDSLATLEKTWIREFPSHTVPLEDWQIFEKVEPFSGFEPSQASMVPRASHLQDEKQKWRSITMKSPFGELPWYDPTLNCSELSGNRPQTWLIAPKGFQVIAVREDFDLRRYALRMEPEDLATTSRAVGAQKIGGEPPQS